MSDTTLGRRLRTARDAAGLTAKAMADRLGVSDSAVSQWELDLTNPRTDLLLALPELLNADPIWLLYGRPLRAPDHPPVQPAHATLPILKYAPLDAISARSQPIGCILPPDGDRSFADIAVDAWDDSNAPLVERGTTLLIRLDAQIRPGALVLAVSSDSEPLIGLAARAGPDAWSIRHSNPLWGSRTLREGAPIVGAVRCLIIRYSLT